jgi:hypothetical protein
MSNWNPVTHPFRAMWIVNTDAPGLHGWSAYVVGCYATENEARTALFADRPRRIRYGQVDRALNPATWQKNGGWARVGARVYPPVLDNGHVIAYKRALRKA